MGTELVSLLEQGKHTKYREEAQRLQFRLQPAGCVSSCDTYGALGEGLVTLIGDIAVTSASTPEPRAAQTLVRYWGGTCHTCESLHGKRWASSEFAACKF